MCLSKKYCFLFKGAERLAEGDARRARGVEGAAQLRRPRRHWGPARPADHLCAAGEYPGKDCTKEVQQKKGKVQCRVVKLDLHQKLCMLLERLTSEVYFG